MAIGDSDDRARIILGGAEVFIAEQYEVRREVFTQPAAFSVRLGWGDVAKGIIAKVQPGTTFELQIGGVRQFGGVVDGFDATGDTGATTVVVRGRDGLARLHDAYAKANRTFGEVTYRELTEAVLGETIGDYILVIGNGANRSATAGTTVRADPDTQAETAVSRTSGKVLKIQAGQRWYDFLHAELERGGLFLWQGADGEFVVSTPNASQSPAATIVRRRGMLRNEVTVKRAHWTHDTAHRFSSCLVHGRGGDAESGTKRTAVEFVDAEMTALGFERALVRADPHCTTGDRAELLARRSIAETRRAGWRLEYTLAGHTLRGTSGARVVLGPDTVVRVTDDEFGLDGLFYVEGVRYSRNPQTETTLTLMRPSDLLFGTD